LKDRTFYQTLRNTHQIQFRFRLDAIFTWSVSIDIMLMNWKDDVQEALNWRTKTYRRFADCAHLIIYHTIEGDSKW
jgi:hypothetical protein